eukprot:TRINITY_DN7582_c3_g2_i1.p1 TRINITY_DN7582_c3_g2~~TRINITY_DN7582_c3_g2_i1.p1  ORF type:complete len:153 (+),score=36.30 TRINITY_DN7582_c3_g2_i1:523-981(+)
MELYSSKANVVLHINGNSTFEKNQILICGEKGNIIGDYNEKTIQFQNYKDQKSNVFNVKTKSIQDHGYRKMLNRFIDVNTSNASYYSSSSNNNDNNNNEPKFCFNNSNSIFYSLIVNVILESIELSSSSSVIIDLSDRWDEFNFNDDVSFKF